MKEGSIGTEPLVELDPRELLGLSQVAKVSGEHAATGRLLNKVGGEGPAGRPSRLAKLLSKIRQEGAIIELDIRLKTDIRQVGTTAHNLPLYTLQIWSVRRRHGARRAQGDAHSGKRR